jgi:hypothetical protein
LNQFYEFPNFLGVTNSFDFLVKMMFFPSFVEI